MQSYGLKGSPFYWPPEGWKNPTKCKPGMKLMVRWNTREEPEVNKEAFITANDFDDARRQVGAMTHNGATRSTIFEKEE